jgi:hypothetical protein
MLKTALWVGVSAFIHGAVLFGILVLGVPSSWAIDVRPDPIAFEILTTPEPHREAQEQLPPPPNQPVPQEPDHESQREPEPERDRQPHETVENVAPLPSVVDVPSIANEEQQPPPVRDPRQERALAVLLSPERVAQQGFVFDDPGPTRRGPPAGLNVDSARPTEQELEGMHSGSLRSEAMTKTHTTRWHPELRPQPDGSYAYSGHRFNATIRPDGQVVFNDRGAVEAQGISASGTFDATEIFMQGAGQDPHRAERERFMSETRELRDRLEREYREREMRAGLRRLRGRLESVWATESRTEQARRRRIFGIWDEMEDGEAGAEGRRIVITFIRAVIPQGSDHEFTPEEIERFNAARESREPFEPY